MAGRARFGNIKKPVIDGHRFDSGAEADRYLTLKLMRRAGLIKNIELQPRIPIIIGGVQVLMRSKGYPNGRKLTYVADFRYIDTATKKTIIEDTKMSSGYRTEVYKIKRALVEAMGLEILET